MIGTAGYNACIGFNFAAFLAQSGKANALASSKLYVVVVHLSNGKRIKEYAASIAWTDWAGKSKESCTRRATARPRGFAKRGPPFATGAKSREVTAVRRHAMLADSPEGRCCPTHTVAGKVCRRCFRISDIHFDG